MTDDVKTQALEFMREHPTSHMTTVEDNKPDCRVMYCPRVDDDFTVWYATSAVSKKIRQINGNPNVCAIFYMEGRYARVQGSAEVITDQEIKTRLWEDDWAKYWKKGPEDEDYVLLKIIPDEVAFFDLGKNDGMMQKIM